MNEHKRKIVETIEHLAKVFVDERRIREERNVILADEIEALKAEAAALRDRLVVVEAAALTAAARDDEAGR